MDPIQLLQSLLVTAVACLVLVGLPGYAAARLLIPREVVSLPGAVAHGTMLGVGITALPAAAFLVLHGSLGTLLVVLALLSAAGLGMLVLVRRPPPRIEPEPSREPWPLPAMVAIGIVVLLGVSLRAATVRGDTGDHWVYLAYMRHFLTSTSLTTEGVLTPFQDARMEFSGWLVLESVLTRVTGLEPDTIHCVSLPVLLTLVAVAAFAVLARQVDRRPGFLSLAIVVQLSLWLSTLSWTEAEKDPGFSLVARAAEDKILSWQVLLPPALALVLALLRGGAHVNWKRYSVAIALSVVALSVTHPIGPVLFALAVGSLSVGLVARALWWSADEPNGASRTRARARSRATAVVVVVLALSGLGVSLAGRRAMHEAGFERQFSPDTREYRGALEERFLTMSDSGRYRASLALLQSPILLGAMLSLPLLASQVRTSLGALFLVTNLAIPAAALYVPLVATELGRWMTPYQIYRLHWIWPASLSVSFALLFATRLAKRRASTRGARSLVLPVAVWALFAAAFLRGDIRRGLRFVEQVRGHETLPAAERELLMAVAEQARPGEVVMAYLRVSVHIPAFAPQARVLVFRDWQAKSGARRDLRDWYLRGELDERTFSLIDRYDVGLIVLGTRSRLRGQLSSRADAFQLLFENSRFGLYRVSRRGGG